MVTTTLHHHNIGNRQQTVRIHFHVTREVQADSGERGSEMVRAPVEAPWAKGRPNVCWMMNEIAVALPIPINQGFKWALKIHKS
jgi:hypothetical protein